MIGTNHLLIVVNRLDSYLLEKLWVYFTFNDDDFGGLRDVFPMKVFP